MTEPTPAPWRWLNPSRLENAVFGDSFGAEALIPPTFDPEQYPPERPGEAVLWPSCDDSAIEYRNEADARLIEKAPEMLALLRNPPLPTKTPLASFDGLSYANWILRVDPLVAYILGETP